MKASQLRSKMSEQLLERRKESYNTNEGGLKFGSIIKSDLDVQEWWCKEGEHLIDIIPYIAGDNNPERKIKKGEISDHATYYVHKNVGANDAMLVCPAANFGRPCPICEHSKELREEGVEDEVWKAVRPKRMTVYNIVVYDDDKEEKKGVQIWVVAHWNMERHLNVLAQKPRDGGKILFSHPDLGKSIAFKRTGSQKDNTQYLGHKFDDRPEPIADEILDSAYCLEEIVHIPEYDEIAAAYYGSKVAKTPVTAPPVVEEEEEPVVEEKPRRGRLRPKPVVKAELPECFGLEIDRIDECQECNEYDDCMKKAEELEQEQVPEPTPPPKSTLRSRLNRR